MENFELIVSLKADGNVPFHKYKSKETGLIVCIAEVPGPIVTGYLCLATEAHDDDGLPHTLEHLIFMGSQDYPFKGVLDMLANRCLASGTNAWTDTDHTCYTMTSAGSEGFLRLLPIYLDHILYPTLTDAAFVTEVHHVNGQGEDAGVVYCEMQACENRGESLCHLHTVRALYPGHCGYKSETGGLMKNLRESTNNVSVREFHQQFYRPENLCIIITGQCNAPEVFKSLDAMEKKIMANKPKSEFDRPWQSEVPVLTSSIEQLVKYPCDDNTHGLLYMAWRGPKASEFSELMSVYTLMEYLTYSSVSPLQKTFVETTDPYCSKIGFSVNENYVSCLYLTFSNVPVAKLTEIRKKLTEVLTNLCTDPKALDMERMKTTIHRRRLNILSQMECSPHDSIALNIIGDFLYGTKEEDLRLRIQHIPLIDEMAKQPAEYWVNLLKIYLLDGPAVVTTGLPDADLMVEMGQNEKDRIELQRKELGSEGLEEKQKALEKSIEANEIEPPPEVITAVPVPSTDSIQFHSISRSCNFKDEAVSLMPFSPSQLPFRLELDLIQSSFVELTVMMDTTNLPEESRLYLPIFLQLLTESPIQRGDVLVPYEEVVAELAADTIDLYCTLGLESASKFSCGSFGQMCTLSFKVEKEKFAKAIQWLRDILYLTVFSPSRVDIIATKMINDVAENRREGIKIANTLLRNMLYTRQSNHWNTSMFRQHKFLKETLFKLNTEPDTVIEQLNQIRSTLTTPSNFLLHIAGNVKALFTKDDGTDPVWDVLIDQLKKVGEAEISSSQYLQDIQSGWKPVTWDYDLFVKNEDRNIQKSSIIGVGSVESAYLIQTVSSISNYRDPDLPALLVLLQYLTQLEGPLWRQLRGQGLAYSYSMTLETSKGLFYLILARCTHVAAAYSEAKRIVLGYVNGEIEFDEELLESARSSLVYEIVEREKSVSDMSLESRLAYFRRIDMNYTKSLIELISKVTLKEIQTVGLKYLSDVFDSEKSLCALCCNPSKTEELVKAFKEMGREFTVVENIEDSFVSTY